MIRIFTEKKLERRDSIPWLIIQTSYKTSITYIRLNNSRMDSLYQLSREM